MKTFKHLMTVSAILGLPLAASANLIVDGSFEPPPDGGGSFQTIYSPGATIGGASGWTVTAGSVDVIGGYWQAQNGNQSVDMSGYANGTIEQTVNLTAGTTYHLTFWMSGNPDGPPIEKQLLASLGGSTVEFDYSIGSNTHTDMDYLLESAYFTAVGGGPTILKFADISAPAGQGGFDNVTPWGAVIDNVQLAAVPETTTIVAGLLLLLPLGASAVRIIRNRKAQIV